MRGLRWASASASMVRRRAACVGMDRCHQHGCRLHGSLSDTEHVRAAPGLQPGAVHVRQAGPAAGDAAAPLDVRLLRNPQIAHTSSHPFAPPTLFHLFRTRDSTSNCRTCLSNRGIGTPAPVRPMIACEQLRAPVIYSSVAGAHHRRVTNFKTILPQQSTRLCG